MKKIVFLATYLRSGSTWLRFLLTNLLYKEVKTSREIDQFIPEIPMLEEIFKPLPTDRDLIVKTHLPLSRALISGRPVVGAIYLVRNPFDVTVSLANFYLRGTQGIESKGEEEIEKVRQYYLDHMLDWGAPHPCYRDGVGAWTNHVASWMGNDELKVPVLLIRYEDLLKDPESELKRICRSIELDVDADRIERAIKLSSWENMKRLEEHEIQHREEGIFYNKIVHQGVEKGFRFLYKGQASISKNVLVEEQIERGIRTFSPLLQWLNYSPPDI